MTSATHAQATASDRRDQLEAGFRELKAVLDDPLQLLDRLRELEIQRRPAK